jgi:hypothetical protein
MRRSTDLHMSIREFNEKRNKLLMAHDLEGLRKFLRERKMPCPKDNMTMLVTMHKSITAVLSLPKEFRQRSKDWLTQRGLQSLDDGDLT